MEQSTPEPHYFRKERYRDQGGEAEWLEDVLGEQVRHVETPGVYQSFHETDR